MRAVRLRAAIFAAALGVAVSHAGLAAEKPATQLRIDLVGDGKLDTVLLSRGDATVTVLVRFADPARKPERFRFPVDPAREDAVCKRPVRVQAESLDYDLSAATGEDVPGFARSKTAKGFQIVDGTCDSIHFFWNHKTQRMEWWRL